MRQSVNFFKSTKAITRSLARLTGASHGLFRRLNRFTELMMTRPVDDVAHRDAVIRKTAKYVYRASKRVAAQARKLQSRTHALIVASEGLIEWFRERSADDRIATFALIPFLVPRRSRHRPRAVRDHEEAIARGARVGRRAPAAVLHRGRRHHRRRLRRRQRRRNRVDDRGVRRS